MRARDRASQQAPEALSHSDSRVHALILDMDGVLWRDVEPIGDLPEIFALIRSHNLPFVLATNNSTRSVDQYLAKLEGFGVDLAYGQIVNSSQATAQHLLHRFPNGGPVYIIGEAGLNIALNENGFYHEEDHPQAVVAGMDRKFNFEKLARATALIRSGLPFIGTNPDNTFPTPQGLIPGTGALLAALEAATGVKPFIVGKPSPEMYRVALERLQTAPEETLVIGDRLETDIAGAQALGCQTALVLSGVTPPEKAQAWRPSPDYIEKDLTALLLVVFGDPKSK